MRLRARTVVISSSGSRNSARVCICVCGGGGGGEGCDSCFKCFRNVELENVPEYIAQKWPHYLSALFRPQNVWSLRHIGLCA